MREELVLKNLIDNFDWACRMGFMKEIEINGQIAYILTAKGVASLKKERIFDCVDSEKH